MHTNKVKRKKWYT